MKTYAKLLPAMLALTVGAAWGAQTTVGAVIDDAALTAKVKTALIENPATKARQIDVDTKGGVVQLNGFVDSAAAKSAAETAALGVAGVRKVNNNLDVRAAERSVGGAIDDTAITTKVKASLLVDGRTKGYQIDVKTNHGTVMLGGFVATAAEKSAAQDLAGSIEGVAKVENNIVVDNNKHR